PAQWHEFPAECTTGISAGDENQPSRVRRSDHPCVEPHAEARPGGSVHTVERSLRRRAGTEFVRRVKARKESPRDRASILCEHNMRDLRNGMSVERNRYPPPRAAVGGGG